MELAWSRQHSGKDRTVEGTALESQNPRQPDWDHEEPLMPDFPDFVSEVKTKTNKNPK